MPHIHIHRPIARFANFQLQFPEELHLTPEDQLAVIGPNGSGKSMFAQYLLGKIALKGGQVQVLENHSQTLPRQAIKYIAFKDIHQLSAGFDQYYQKRWNATENEASPLVSEVLGEEKCARALRRFACFQVEKLLQKRLIFLSSGEMRKLQLMEALLDQAQLLIIDNPYIGLDAAGRDSINQILEALIEEKKLQVILLISQPQDIPSWINKVLPMLEKNCLEIQSAKTFIQDKDLHIKLFPELNETLSSETKSFFQSKNSENDHYDFVLQMNKVGLRYYQKQILQDID
ncbi:MAG: ATP-binding cassette domain-containing protein, partial [Bacteroidales bacterium]|nr:ATP-binding cassette domain-containing protein [Bacteroidales bacterium]